MLEPFAAVRYNDPRPNSDEGVLELDGVVIPFVAAANPADYAAFLEDMNSFNAFRLLETDQKTLWRDWLNQSVLKRDEQPLLYIYRIGYRDSSNTLQQTTAVVGELNEVANQNDDGAADVIPLILEINAPGFSELLHPTGVPLARATTQDGAHHRLWALDQPGVINTIKEAVQSAKQEGRLGRGEVEDGSGSQMAFIAETIEAETIPALGMLFRERD